MFREQASNVHSANFLEGGYVLVTRDECSKGERLCKRWNGYRSIINDHNDYMFDVENLRPDNIDSFHGSRLMYCGDSSLGMEVIISNVLNSETGIPSLG